MGLFTKKSDGSYNYISADNGLIYVRSDDYSDYMSQINDNK